MVLVHEPRAFDAISRREFRAEEDARVVPASARKQPCGGMRFERRGWLGRDIGFLDRLSATLGFHLKRLDLDILLRTDEAEALLVGDLEQGAHAAQARERNRE